MITDQSERPDENPSETINYDGECIHQVSTNAITGRRELVVLKADRFISITNEMAQDIFDYPHELGWGRVDVKSKTLYLVFNGRNRQVEYKLVEYLGGKEHWHAIRTGDSEQ